MIDRVDTLYSLCARLLSRYAFHQLYRVYPTGHALPSGRPVFLAVRARRQGRRSTKGLRGTGIAYGTVVRLLSRDERANLGKFAQITPPAAS